MTAGLAIPSVHAIRAALEGVDGAIRDNPLPEDAHDGTDPAVEIWMSDPDVGREFAALNNPDPTIDDDVIASNGPAVIFEIPPEATDADIEHVLGQDTLTEMSRLHEIRGIDAYGWYVTFHQRTAQHGVHIPLEGAPLMAARVFHHLPIADERKVNLAFHAILRRKLVDRFAGGRRPTQLLLSCGAELASWLAGCASGGLHVMRRVAPGRVRVRVRPGWP